MLLKLQLFYDFTEIHSLMIFYQLNWIPGIGRETLTTPYRYTRCNSDERINCLYFVFNYILHFKVSKSIQILLVKNIFFQVFLSKITVKNQKKYEKMLEYCSENMSLFRFKYLSKDSPVSRIWINSNLKVFKIQKLSHRNKINWKQINLLRKKIQLK